MATASFTTPSSPLTMTALAAFLDAALGELRNAHRGASAPDSPIEGQRWWDTSGGATAEVLKRYTVAAGWVSILTVNITAGTIVGLSALLDEDNMASDSAVLPPSQQSAKAYFMAKTGANLAIGSDADGDMYYRASGVLARLAKGAANTKLFTNAGATAPEWGPGAFVGSLTRDLTGATADVAYTGVGFKPSVVLFLGSYTTSSVLSSGTIMFSNASVHGGISSNWYDASSVPAWYAAATGMIKVGVGSAQSFIIKTLDSDGFTLTWTKNGTPTGTGTLYYLAFR